MTHEGQIDYKNIWKDLSGSKDRLWNVVLENQTLQASWSGDPQEEKKIALELLSSYVLFPLR